MKRFAFGIALLLAATQALAQQYPVKPVRIVIPFGPGSSTDVITRIVAEPVAAALGQPVVVDPKPGGDGAIAAIEVAKAAPDGYTLLIGSGSPMAAVPYLRKSPPYNPLKDFTPITDIGRYTVFLFTNAALPVKSLQEFIAYAKANPGKMSYATGNASGIVAFAQMNTLAGIELLHVPYKSAPPAMLDLVAGRVDAMMDPPTTGLPYVRDGKLRALVTTLNTRSPLLPDVPTIHEAGIPQFTISNWMGLVGPAGMPPAIVDRLNREFAAALKRPEVLAALDKQAFIPNPSTPQQFADFIKEQVDSYAMLLRASGVPQQ
ncbi:MAG: Bug family tripartite tricarboxylate transporter substrate binding protein [Burkholderiaceae bacterium]